MKFLTRKGYLIEEQGMTYLTDTDPDLALGPLQAAACPYRIALGPLGAPLCGGELARHLSHITRGLNETADIHLKGRDEVLPVSRNYLHLFRQM